MRGRTQRLARRYLIMDHSQPQSQQVQAQNLAKGHLIYFQDVVHFLVSCLEAPSPQRSAKLYCALPPGACALNRCTVVSVCQ